MAQFGVQETKRAFNEPSLRPEPWAPLKNGKPARLRKNNLLARSPRVVRITQSGATIGTDRPYAAYHQQGTKAIPRRAFFPFHKNGRATKRFIRRLKPVIIKRLGI
jgi:phage gpG-like protein